MNNGIFALRPSREILDCMLWSAYAGIYWAEPFEQDFQRRGGTWMAFLDLLWRHGSCGGRYLLLPQAG